MGLGYSLSVNVFYANIAFRIARCGRYFDYRGSSATSVPSSFFLVTGLRLMPRPALFNSA